MERRHGVSLSALMLLVACGVEDPYADGVKIPTGGSTASGPTGPVGTPPATPTGVAAIGGAFATTLSWNAVTGADGYRIYWSLAAGVSATSGAPINSRGTAFVHSGLIAGETYHYIVVAVRDRAESPASTEVSATPDDTEPGAPAAPTNVVVVPGDGELTVSWNPVSGATDYVVYIDETISMTTPTQVPTTQTNIVLDDANAGIVNGTLYYVEVTARAGSVESVPSLQASGTPGATFSAPTNVVVYAGDGSVAVGWDDNPAAFSYAVYWGTTPGAKTSSEDPIYTNRYTVTGLDNGTTYYFIVTANDLENDSPDSVEVSATPQVGAGLQPPTGVTVTPRDGLVLIDWTDSAGATGYVVHRGTFSGFFLPSFDRVQTSEAPAVVAGLENGVTTYFVVVATNGVQDSEGSTEVTGQPVAGAITFSEDFTTLDTRGELLGAGFSVDDITPGSEVNDAGWEVGTDTDAGTDHLDGPYLFANSDFSDSLYERLVTPTIALGSAPVLSFTYIDGIFDEVPMVVSIKPSGGAWTPLTSVDPGCFLQEPYSRADLGCRLTGYASTSVQIGFELSDSGGYVHLDNIRVQ